MERHKSSISTSPVGFTPLTFALIDPAWFIRDSSGRGIIGNNRGQTTVLLIDFDSLQSRAEHDAAPRPPSFAEHPFAHHSARQQSASMLFCG
jgi:hypothetical protein